MPSSLALEVKHLSLVCPAEPAQSRFSTSSDSSDLLCNLVQLGL